MLERDMLRLVETAVDTAIGWGRSEAVVCDPPTHRLADRHRWAGLGGRVVKVRREGFGVGFQQMNTSAYLAVNLNASPDEIVCGALEQCSQTIRNQTELRARAACAGIDGPLDRDGFIDLARLNIDVAAARTLSSALGSDADVRDWLQNSLADLFDHGAVSRFFAQGFAILVPFRLAPLRLAFDGRIPSREDHWCGRTVQLSFPPAVAAAEVKARLEATLLATTLGDRPVLEFGPWPTPGMTAAIERHSRRSRSAFFRPANDTATWRAVVEHRLVRVEEVFG